MKTEGKTYGQALKSSTLIGGASFLSVVLAAVRAKVMAVLLGPAGVGLLGLFSSIFELSSISGMGINNSGVRQIAEAASTSNSGQIARTVTTLRRVALYLGLLGGLLLLIFCKPIAQLTFGNNHHAGSVALLSLAVFFGTVSAGQGALIQGMRQIRSLARMKVLGAFYGTLFSIPIIYYFRERGVVAVLICVAGMGIVTSWWYARKIKIESIAVNFRQIVDEASTLLKLGSVFMAIGIMAFGTAYLIRIILSRKIGIEATGFFQAAWVLGGFYVSFILQAMGADFFPRLTGVVNDHAECNRLVNEQAEVSLLLAVPGVLGTLTFAPLVIHLFYSAKFEPAVEILRWICLGMTLRVATWPMGYILPSKGAGKLYLWTEAFGSALQLGLAWVGVTFWGVEGAGVSFFIANLGYGIYIYTVVRRLSGFRWSAANRQLAFIFVPLLAVVFICWYFLSRPVAMAVGATITLLVGIYSLRTLCVLVPFEQMPAQVQKIILRFRSIFIKC